MKAIVLPGYNANIIRAMKSLEVKEMPIPRPAGDEVLIRVSGAPCNPSDIAFMRGGYNIRKPLPATMGFECTGTVMETGSSPEAKNLLGKKVSCFGREQDGGTWAEYFLTASENCLENREDLPSHQAAALCINPFTSYALIQLAINCQARAIIQNAASGQIGINIRTLAKKHGLKVINLVRKADQVEKLREEGENYTVDMSDAGFPGKLEALAKGLHATVAFDAVGGDTSGLILNAMPEGSRLVIYGGLSGKPAGQFDPLDIIFKGKVVQGFNLHDWKKDIGKKAFDETSWEIQQMMIDGLLTTRIQGTFSLEEIQQAMEQYIRNMSAGKILFIPR